MEGPWGDGGVLLLVTLVGLENHWDSVWAMWEIVNRLFSLHCLNLRKTQVLMFPWGCYFGFVTNVTGVSISATFFSQLILKAECFGCSAELVRTLWRFCRSPQNFYLKCWLVLIPLVVVKASQKNSGRNILPSSQVLFCTVCQHPRQPLDRSAYLPSLQAPYCCCWSPAVTLSLEHAGSVLVCRDAAGAKRPWCQLSCYSYNLIASALQPIKSKKGKCFLGNNYQSCSLSCKFPFFLISFYLKFIILGRRKLEHWKNGYRVGQVLKKKPKGWWLCFSTLIGRHKVWCEYFSTGWRQRRELSRKHFLTWNKFWKKTCL